MATLLSPSGGLVYHLRAWRYHQNLWQPFRQALGEWLEFNWSPPLDRPLILIGCSAGWCLPIPYLKSFTEVHAFDLDPVALWILKRRGTNLRIKTQNQDALGIEDTPTGQTLEDILKRPGLENASILFCNLWGQLYFDDTKQATLKKWQERLPEVLQGRNWASFFDRVSGPIPPDISSENCASPRSLTDEEVIKRYYQNETMPPHSGLIELQDHMTAHYFADQPRDHFNWQLEPNRFHLIEAIHA